MDLIPVTINNKEYNVPSGLTVMKAMEYVGYRFIRGCGCRGGICGACGFMYRKKGSNELRPGLACQTVVEPEMSIAQMLFFPYNKASYDLETLPVNETTIVNTYSEILTCLGCNSCTNICPQELDVMEYVAMAIRGDYERLTQLSFECIMCGLCVSRCPRGLIQPYYAILGRRVYVHSQPGSPMVKKRVREMEQGKYKEEYNKLMNANLDELKEMYSELQRNKEPD